MKIVYLKPKSSFRNNLRSDTLWGLLCWGIKNIFGEDKLTEFLSSYKIKNNVLKISSAFPFVYKDGKRILFFPRPILKPIDLNEYFDKNKLSTKKDRSEVISKLKSYKKIKYLPEDVFFELLNGKITEYDLFKSEDVSDADKLLSKSFTTVEMMHNTINRLTNTTLEGNLYIDSDIFIYNGGLYFLIDGDDEDVNLILASIRFLSHLGFAGDSAIGKGHFDISVDDYSLTLPTDANSFITLSLYFPKEDEVKEFKKYPDKCWYELETRKGKYGGQFIKDTNFWKDSVLMFKEGSVLPNLQKNNYGLNKTVKKTAEFDVLQFGFSFNLPFKAE